MTAEILQDPCPTAAHGPHRWGSLPRLIVLHWAGGSGDAAALGRYWRSDDARTRKASSHYGVDEHGVRQYLPDEARAYHAGAANRHSIGVDICSPPMASQLDAATRRGLACHVEGQYLTLDPRIVAHTRALVETLCARHHLPVTYAPRDEVRTVDQWAAAGVVVVGHHHLTARKADVRPWWPQVVRGV